jgi:MYXO-CTERM domain-containing protein
MAVPTSEAAAQVFQPGTQPVGADGGIVEDIQPSRPCGRCHGNYEPAEDLEPYDTWRGALMSSAMRDPIARAAIAIAEEDAPGGADFCLRCHTPVAWFRGRSTLPEYDPASPGYPERLADDRATTGGGTGLSDEQDGVGCMVCHRMVAPPMPSMIANAQLVLADGAEAEARRGPYAYGPGEDPRHETAVEPFLSTSELCGSCHDIHNPLREGHRGATPTGRPMAIERTYSEWRYSAFADRGQTCQSCHMPEVEAPAAGDGPFRPRMSRHDLVGGNVWVPLALAERVRVFDPVAARALETSSRRAREMLERAATLDIRASTLDGARARATVRVTNRSGHRLPTGYPEGRRMWLEVAIVDGSGRVVAGSGLYDEERATLRRDPQLRTYEAKLGQGATESFHFILNDTLIEDTRIPPEGFRAPPEADAAPLGRDYGDGAGGYRHWDEVEYVFDELCGEGMLTLRARLRYQSTTREYVEFLRDTAPPSPDPELAGRSWGDIAFEAWRMHGGGVPVDMAVASAPLGPAPRACPEPAPDAGSDAGGDAGGEPIDAGGGGPVAGGDGGGGGGERVGGCGCRAAAPRGDRAFALAALAALAFVRRRHTRGGGRGARRRA